MRRIKLGVLLAVMLFALLAGPGSGLAGEKRQEPPPPPAEMDLETVRERRLAQLAGELPPQIDPAADPLAFLAQPADSGLSTPGIADWSRIVYQVWAGDNYEIYIADGDGRNARRLTYNSASDAVPSLTRGGTRIAFASNRDGDFEIYTMNPDGSDVRQITFNTNWDSLPAWSPDGSKLAYVSPQGEWHQIYTINADGSGWTQMTYTALDSLDPVWSPDGTQIAFTTWDERGYGDVWVMPRGGGAATALSGYTSLFLPADTSWSPNGGRIAWDTTNPSWGLVDTIYTIDLTYHGVSGVTVHNMTPYEDHLVGSWSPDNTQLIFNRIQYTVVNNQVYIMAASVETVCALSGSYCERPDSQLPAPGFAFYPEWQSIDIEAPVTHFEPLPQYARADGFVLSWSSEGLGPAPITRYDVRYLYGASSWNEKYLPDPDQNSEWLKTAAPGDTVVVEVRGRDEAGNLEAWESNPGASVTTQLFTDLVGGFVGDPRGFALANASLVFEAAIDRTPAVRANGRYLAYTTGEGLYTVSASAPGFGALPATSRAAMGDRWQDFYFPAANNLIQNGTFEQGSLSGWTAVISPTNATPTETLHISLTQAAGQYLTGQQGVTLGDGCAEPCLSAEVYETWLGRPAQAGASSYQNSYYALGSDGQDRLYVLAYRSDGLYFSLRQADGTWDEPELLEAMDWGYSRVQMRVLDSGEAYAVWDAPEYAQHYAHRSANGVWSAPAPLPEIAPGESMAFHDMTVDRQGNLLLLSQREGYLVVYKLTPQGTWRDPVQVNDRYSTSWFYAAVLAVGQDGTIHTYWTDYDGAYYSGRRPDGSLLDTIQLSDYWSGPIANELLALVDGQDNLHVFEDRIHRIRYSDGTWGPATTLEGVMVSADYNDEMVVASTYGFGLRWTNGGGWERLGGELQPPLVLDAVGGIHTVNFVEHYQGRRASAAGQASLQQVVTVPANMVNPTLAFAARLRGEPGQERSYFAVSISTGVTTTQVYTSTARHGWEHAWVDLEAWAGETITVTFSLYQAAGEPLLYLDLDDVSLGAWLTPVIYGVKPEQIEAPAAGMVVQLLGDNFSAGSQVYLNGTQVEAGNVTFIDAQHLTFTLPGGFEVGPNDVKIVNPDGRQFTLADGLQLGRRLYLPLVRR